MCVDDYLRFTWTRFLRDKYAAVVKIVDLIIQLHIEKETKLKAIKSDHGREFKI